MNDRGNRESMRAAREDARRGKSPPAPRAIADVLSGLLARRGYARVLAASELDAAWAAAAGELAKESRAGQVRGGVLEVLVRNSAVVQELTFQKRLLVRRLAEAVPDQKIKDLRFRVGSWE